MTSTGQPVGAVQPILLFNDECGVCRFIARWVERSAARSEPGGVRLRERPIGDDPEALRVLNPALDIWDAYATIHLLMPDGSMKLGGEAVAEVLRDLPNTKWFAWIFAVRVLGARPFQAILDVAYLVLADVRPLFGCESCGAPRFWTRPLAAVVAWVKVGFGVSPGPNSHSTTFPRAADAS